MTLKRHRLRIALALIAGLLLPFLSPRAGAQVVINEIMYHPVEEPAFNTDGTPFLDLTEDVHEFIELHNPGTSLVSIAGWKLTGGIRYTFPSTAAIPAGGFLVVAKNKARLASIPVYGLREADLFGPYDGLLSNSRDTIRLNDPDGVTVDSVSYSAEFPWPIGADALGADQEWSGLDPKLFQYRGRSLERVSVTVSGNDPANWLASPVPGEPSPGRANARTRAIPLPVVVNLNLYQASNEQLIIRSNQPVRLDALFSGTNELGPVQVEYFIDDVNVTNEVKTVLDMTPAGPASNGKWTVVLPGQANRAVVRYRILANRAGVTEIVSPRAGDPFLWHAYFVSPTRTSVNPIYDIFISSAGLTRLDTNINGNPKRIISPDPPGNPRPSWNATEPAIFVVDGVVRDIRMRYHGSRYNRRASRQSYKFQFPKYGKFNNQTGVFETDKVADTIAGHGIFRAAGLPTSVTRWVDFYLNGNNMITRLEQEEYDENMLERYHAEQKALNPGSALEQIGEIYKCVGTIDENGEGPYGRGDGRTYGVKGPWTPLQQYEWTFTQQDHTWKGMTAFKKMIDGMWAARGDTRTALNPNVPALRAFFLQNFDVDKTLTYLAVLNWMGPWDDTTQNHFLWQQADGKWTMLPWDFDSMFGGGSPSSASLYAGEVNDPSNNFRGPNYFKDSFIKAFREELKQRFFLLVNTLLHPDNITALGYGSFRSFAVARQASVNQQCGYGTFERPGKPSAVSPAVNAQVFPPSRLQATPYTHSSAAAPAHASTTWEVRAADGSYLAPVVKVTSSTNLTELTIPFSDLDYGRQYFWRATYFDVNGHPSFASDERAFYFGGTATTTTNVTDVVTIGATTTWKYDQSGNFPGSTWISPAFNDSAWSSGAPLLALETASLPEPIRTTLSIGTTRLAYYFRTHFVYSGPLAGTALRLRYVIDDGAVIYLNGRELHRVRMASGTPDATTLATVNVGDAAYEGPFEVAGDGLVQGDNVLAVEVHQSAANSSDIVFGLSVQVVSTSTSVLTTGQIMLSEIMADNRTGISNAGDFPDWIELYNDSDLPVSLAGYSLTDNELAPARYQFPASASIPGRGYQIVWCDDRTNSPGLHTGFGLDDRGQNLLLFGPGTQGLALKDSVVFGIQAPDLSISKEPGLVGWRLSKATPGTTNISQPLGSNATLKINEWLAISSAGDDWFELFNPDALPVAVGGLFCSDSSLDPTNTVIKPLSYLAPRGFARFWADSNPQNGANHVNFKLSADGESIFLYNTNRVLIDSITFRAQTTDIAEGRLPDGAASIRPLTTTTPGNANYVPLTTVVINEVLTHSRLPFEDAIELFNTTSNPINVSGWYLSDSGDQPDKFRIPGGAVLQPRGFLVFYENQFNADTNSPTSFALSSSKGDEVWLSSIGGNGQLDGFRAHAAFDAAELNVSLGRIETSHGVDFGPLIHPSFGRPSPASVTEFRQGAGAANEAPLISPVVISEIMYHPPDIGTGTNTVDNVDEEFIELHNRTGTVITLFDPAFSTNTWRISGGVDFTFPQNVSIAPGASVVLVSFDPRTNSVATAAFRSRYPSAAGAELYGPYRGKLSNSGNTLTLSKPDQPIALENNFVPYVPVDRVEFTDHSPWPVAADGGGQSLHRVDVAAYANEALNWRAAAPSPGFAGAGPGFRIGPIRISDGRFIMAFSAKAQTSYTVQVSDVPGLPWQKLQDILSEAQDHTVEISDSIPAGKTARFYRIISN